MMAGRSRVIYAVRKAPRATLFYIWQNSFRGKPDFVARGCPFDEAREVYLDAYGYWRSDSQGYLDIKKGQVASDSEEAWRRALIYCFLRPHVDGGSIYSLKRTIIAMPAISALYWAGLYMRAYYNGDKRLIRKIIKALKIIYLD